MIDGLKIWAKTWLGRSCIWRFVGSAKHLWRFPNYPGVAEPWPQTVHAHK